MARHLIVSNRQPRLDDAGRTAGGLAVALTAALRGSGGLWLGWSGRVVAAPPVAPRQAAANGVETLTIDLSPAEHRGYYLNFANRTLWPLLHGRLDLARFDHDDYALYRSVNRRFAEALKPAIRAGDRIWVHDYHLIPLASALRRLGVRAPIGFFLHVPFPEGQPLESLPWLTELLGDFRRYDLVGFQTARCRDNFRDTLTRALGGRAGPEGALTLGGETMRTGAFPISIDTAGFRALATAPPVLRRQARLERMMGPQDWVLGVERLDYTKGLSERFLAFERLLETHPTLQGQVSLLQIAAPSRLEITEYREMQERLERLVGRINGRFATEEWPPLRYINRSFTHAHLAALYRRCRVGLVTPLRDGMNLVAKEYVAAQDAASPGVLVLSRFAGAAEQMSEALIVNPFDLDETAAAIRHALVMGREERCRRWTRLMADLERDDVHAWVRGFLAALEQAARLSAARRDPTVA